MLVYGGEAGIRTLDGLLTHAGFQDRCIQPLCHLSEGAKGYRIFQQKQGQIYHLRSTGREERNRIKFAPNAPNPTGSHAA